MRAPAQAILPPRHPKSKMKRLMVALTVASAISALATRPGTAQTGPEWLTAINEYRSLAGIAPVTDLAEASSGAAAHSSYMVSNNALVHAEDPSKPGYSESGSRAGSTGNIIIGAGGLPSDRAVIDHWIAAPFHGIGMIQAYSTEFGFGTSTNSDGWAGTLSLFWNQPRAAKANAPAIVWPGANSSIPILRFVGPEHPDPLTRCPGFAEPLGVPIYVSRGIPTEVSAASLVDETLSTVPTTKGKKKASRIANAAIPLCIISAGTYTNANNTDQQLGRSVFKAYGAVALIPKSPFVSGHTYRVAVRLTDGTRLGWKFSAGALRARS
jgi:Cysteine-rich secretory protein family